MLYLLCFIAGGLTSLSLPPAGLSMAFCAFALPLSSSCTSCSAKRSAAVIWFAAWGYFSVSLYWLGSALFMGPEIFVWLTPVVCLGFPAFIALFWAVPAYISHRVVSLPVLRLLILITALGVSEYLRTILFTGFPWNAPAQSVMASLYLAQSAAFIGQHGLNIIMFMIAGSVVCFYHRQERTGLFLLLPTLVVFSGAIMRMSDAPPLASQKNVGPQIRIVQPNVLQHEKWDREKRDGHLRDMSMLSASHTPMPQLTLLPETGIAGRWPDEAPLVRSMARATTAFDGYLITGIIGTDTSGSQTQFYNTAIMLSHQGALIGQYDKKLLVPFGEYVPFRGIPFIDAIAGPSDFSVGKTHPYLTAAPYGNISIFICYESVFPDFLAREMHKKRPDLIVNLTNDGWFGHTAGPWQHLTQARMRAIEEGVPVMRAANTGVSAGIDGYGRLLGHIPLGISGYIDIPAPPVLPSTFYAQNRYLGISLLIIWLIIGLFCLVRQNKNGQ